MPEDASKKKFAYLDHLSTAELEALLHAAALSEDFDDPAMMDYLLEVIVKREQETNDLPDMDRMREDFETLYRGLEEPLYPSEDFSSTSEISKLPTPKKKPLRRLLLAAALAVFLIAVTCFPVFGYSNVVQMVAYWTAERFGFHMADKDPESGSLIQQSNQQFPEEYQELQTILSECGIHLSVPEFPESYKAGGSLLSVDSVTGNVEFSIIYTQDTKYISFDLIQGTDTPITTYEKDDNDIEIYQYAGISHYIFSNNEKVMAVWIKEDIEYCLSTNSTSIDMTNLIRSIYKE